MVQRESAEGWCAVPKAAPLDPMQYNTKTINLFKIN